MLVGMDEDLAALSDQELFRRNAAGIERLRVSNQAWFDTNGSKQALDDHMAVWSDVIAVKAELDRRFV